LHEVVAAAVGDLEGLANQHFRVVEVAELPLDHAEVAGLRRDQPVVSLLAHERQPLAHPVPSLAEVSGDLRPDAEEMERIRPSGDVPRPIAQSERLAPESSGLGDVGSERDSNDTAERA